MKRLNSAVSFAIAFACFGLSCQSVPQTVLDMTDRIEWINSGNAFGSACVRIADSVVMYVDPSAIQTSARRGEADLILVTHDHADHFNAGTIRSLLKSGGTVVGPRSVIDALTIAGFEGPRLVTIGQDETIQVGDIAVRSCAMFNDSHAGGSGVGYLVVLDGVRILFTGDSGFNGSQALLGDIDILVVNTLNTYTATAQDVLSMVEALTPVIVIPVHWKNDRRDLAILDAIREGLPRGVELRTIQRRD